MLYTVVYEVHSTVDPAGVLVTSSIDHFESLPFALDYIAEELGDDEDGLADQLVFVEDRRVGTWARENDGDGLIGVWTLIENNPNRNQRPIYGLRR